MTANPKEMLDQVVITYALKYLPCSKPDCLTCLTDKGHGPYWYAYFTLDGVEKDVFLGKSFKPMDLTQILMSEVINGKKMGTVQKEEEARAYESAQAKDHLGAKLKTFKQAQEQARKDKTETTASEQPKNPFKPNPNRIDKVGKVSSFKSKRQASPKLTPPSQVDFEQDMRILQGAARNENLKLVYRKLIKKYHPDQYESSAQLNQWMSEINGVYHKLCAVQR